MFRNTWPKSGSGRVHLGEKIVCSKTSNYGTAGSTPKKKSRPPNSITAVVAEEVLVPAWGRSFRIDLERFLKFELILCEHCPRVSHFLHLLSTALRHFRIKSQPAMTMPNSTTDLHQSVIFNVLERRQLSESRATAASRFQSE
uniref:(northern house mosquito) hypothetical protein n=1 Tax=Culex pipiens TaxID=7175 RepID=A0A8D8CY63_CULPI